MYLEIRNPANTDINAKKLTKNIFKKANFNSLALIRLKVSKAKVQNVV